MPDRLTGEELQEMRERYRSLMPDAIIAHARTDVPRLLDEVERMQGERDRYREALKEIRDTSDLDYDGEQGFMACDMKTIARQVLEEDL